jgi:hypothetical protein
MRVLLRYLIMAVTLSSCATPFPGEPHSEVSMYSSVHSEMHSHGGFVHGHSVEAADRAHFHPNKNWGLTRTVAEEKARRLKRERSRRRMSIATRPRY